MAYGIQVFNSAGATLLDTELQTSIQVPSAPTSFATGTSFTKQREEIILYNRAANGVPLLKKPFGSYTITLGGAVAVNRISVRQTDEDTPPASGTHGINVYDAGGTLTKTFSDSYARSFTIIGIYPTYTLSHNNISDNGIKYLAEGLNENNTLCTLILNGNKISNMGIKYLKNISKLWKILE